MGEPRRNNQRFQHYQMYTRTLLHFGRPLSKVPVVPVEMLPPVVVCTAVSSLVHEIVSPAFIETFDGIKHLSASIKINA